MHPKYAQSGFTLVELIFTIAIGLIFLTMAVPSYTDFTKNNRVTTITNTLVSDINVARSEAIARGVRVMLCRSANPGASSPTCGGTNNIWTTGWLVFASGDGNSTYDAGADTLIRVNLIDAHDVTVISNSTFNSTVQFNPDGTTNAGGSTGLFSICDDRGYTKGNKIRIISTGRPRLLDGSDASTPLNSTDCTNPA